MNLPLIWVIAAAALFGGGFWAGDQWRSGIVAQDALEQKAVNDRAAARVARQGDQAAERHEVVKEVLRTEFVPITETIERVIREPSFSTACLNDDGLRVANAAIAAANAAVRGAASRAEDSKATAPLPAISQPAGASE